MDRGKDATDSGAAPHQRCRRGAGFERRSSTDALVRRTRGRPLVAPRLSGGAAHDLRDGAMICFHHGAPACACFAPFFAAGRARLDAAAAFGRVTFLLVLLFGFTFVATTSSSEHGT